MVSFFSPDHKAEWIVYHATVSMNGRGRCWWYRAIAVFIDFDYQTRSDGYRHSSDSKSSSSSRSLCHSVCLNKILFILIIPNNAFTSA